MLQSEVEIRFGKHGHRANKPISNRQPCTTRMSCTSHPQAQVERICSSVLDRDSQPSAPSGTLALVTWSPKRSRKFRLAARNRSLLIEQTFAVMMNRIAERLPRDSSTRRWQGPEACASAFL